MVYRLIGSVLILALGVLGYVLNDEPPKSDQFQQEQSNPEDEKLRGFKMQ